MRLRHVLLLALAIQAGCSGKPEQQSLNQQFQTAMSLRDLRSRGNKLVRLSYEQTKAGDAVGAERSLQAARKAASQMSDPRDQCDLLNYVAIAFGKLGHPGTTKKVLEEQRDAAKKISNAEQRVPALARMAETYVRFADGELAAKNLLKQAETAAASVERVDDRITALLEVAYYHSRLKHAADVTRIDEQTANLAQSLTEPRPRAEAYVALASGLNRRKSSAATDAYKTAEAAIAKIADPLSRSHTWLMLARRLKQGGMKEQASSTLDKAKSAAEKVKDSSLRKPLMEQISKAYE